jgi:hypothetical protein
MAMTMATMITVTTDSFQLIEHKKSFPNRGAFFMPVVLIYSRKCFFNTIIILI